LIKEGKGGKNMFVKVPRRKGGGVKKAAK